MKWIIQKINNKIYENRVIINLRRNKHFRMEINYVDKLIWKLLGINYFKKKNRNIIHISLLIIFIFKLHLFEVKRI